jgi:hypothetical protein
MEKTCKSCAHYRRQSGYARCAAVSDPVGGGPGAFCDIEREGAGFRTGCGMEGRRWEAKPKSPSPWWMFWRR